MPVFDNFTVGLNYSLTAAVFRLFFRYCVHKAVYSHSSGVVNHLNALY